MKLRFDEERAVQLFTILEDLWKRKAGVFGGIVLPQHRHQLPNNPVQAANYFSYAAITQRGGVVSEDPFKWVSHLHSIQPDLFDPRLVAAHWSTRDIMEVIKRVVTDRQSWEETNHQHTLFDLCVPEAKANGKNEKLYGLDEFAASWHNNSVTLVERWDGNVLNIYDGTADFEEAFARIDHKNPVNKDKPIFTGIRRKIFALFTIWLQERKYIPTFPTPIPVDFHALRLLFATGVVTADGLESFIATPGIHPEHFRGRPMLRVTEEVMDEITLWSQGFLRKHGFSHLAINPALWVLSRELCPHEFQNKSRGRGRVGNRGDIRLVYPEVLRENPSLWPVPYADPSRVCPVAHLCTKAIPNAPYYSFGLLALLERVSYPHPALPGMARTIHPGGRKNNRK